MQTCLPTWKNVKPLGRTQQREDSLWLAFSGAGAEFSFTGSFCRVTIAGDSTSCDPANTANHARIAIYVDGVRVADEMIDAPEKNCTVVDGRMGEHIIRVVKLSETAMSTCGIRSITTDGGIRPTPEKPSLVEFIGDSITQGWDSDYDSLSYAYHTGMYYNADFVVQGIGGAYFLEASYDAIPYDPDTVIVAYGTNDWGHFQTLEELLREANGFLKALSKQFAGKRLFAITPIWRADWETDRPMGNFAQLQAAVCSAATANGFTVIDGLPMVPHLREFFSDGYVHPNATGFGCYAQNLIKALEY